MPQTVTARVRRQPPLQLSKGPQFNPLPTQAQTSLMGRFGGRFWDSPTYPLRDPLPPSHLPLQLLDAGLGCFGALDLVRAGITPLVKAILQRR